MLPSTGWQNSRRDRAHHIGPPRYAENAVGTLALGTWHGLLAFLKNYRRGQPPDPKHAHTFCQDVLTSLILVDLFCFMYTPHT